MGGIKIFTGNANLPLIQSISNSLGKPLGDASISRFNDGETRVQIKENVRGYDIFVIQPTSPPVNDNLMELLIILDALRRASAKRITAVIPYFGYSRQDRKHGAREPITAKLVADIITIAGPNRILFLDLHADQIQGFFNVPVDNLLPDSLFVEYMKEKEFTSENTVIVSPDVGGTRRARRLASYLNLKIALLENREIHNKSQMNVVGELAENAIIVDDMIDTGKRLISASTELKERGVKRVYACCTHPVLSGDMNSIQESCVDELVVTDSILIPENKLIPKLKILSVAPLLAEAIRRIHNEEPLGQLFGIDI
jgi:ribose-phosphate pyrophosphokinase